MNPVTEFTPDIFFQLSPDLLCIASTDGYFKVLNPAWEQTLGWTQEELLSKPFHEFIHPDDAEQTFKEVEKQIRGQETINFINRYLSKNGNYHWFEWRARANSDKTLLYAVARDITEQKKTHEKIREVDLRFSSLFNLPLFGIAITSLDKGWIQVNDEFLRFVGYTLEELKDTSWADLTYPEDFQADNDLFCKVLIGEIDNYILEKRYIRRNGELVWAEISVGCIRKPDGSVDYFVALLHDISLRKEMENELRRSSEYMKDLVIEKDKFFSILSHDLRNPLGTFKNLSRLIEEDFESLTREDLLQALGNLSKSADNVYLLLENLLSWASIQRGMITVEPITFPLNSKIESLVKLVSEIATSKNIEISVDIPVNLHIHADDKMSDSIFLNLLTNALKFTPEKGHIRISATRAREGFAEIHVADNGIGIPAKILPELFRIGSNTGRKGTRNEPTTGLGLILSKEFAEKNGGHIHVESEEGKGSVFTVTLPVETA